MLGPVGRRGWSGDVDTDESPSLGTASALFVVAAEDAAQHAAYRPGAEHGPFVARAAALRRRREHAGREPRERQALQPHRAGAGDLGEEQAFAAEQGGLDLADVLDFEADARRQRDQAAGVDEQRLALPAIRAGSRCRRRARRLGRRRRAAA